LGRNPRPRLRSRASRRRCPRRARPRASPARLLLRSPRHFADTGENLVAPAYTVELGDRAVCHRNATFGDTEAVFISTRLVEDRFGLAFEFFINVAHNFVEAAGVPESFSTLVWSQAEAQVRGESSQDAWENRRRALEPQPGINPSGAASIDERARNAFFESSFSDALAIYMLSLAVDFDYHDLREREYPLSPLPPSPSASDTSPFSSPPTPATNSRSTTAAKARPAAEKLLQKSTKCHGTSSLVP
jgi:hypothetical protein